MKTRNYLIYDVFTPERLAGNPLAVVLDCEGLDTAAMQAHRARVQSVRNGLRAAAEKPAASRPGSASSRPTMKCRLPAIRRSARRSRLPKRDADDGAAGIFVLEENIGPVRCAVVAERMARPSPSSTCRNCRERLELSVDAGDDRRSARAWRRTRSASRITASPVVGGRALCDGARRRPRRRRPRSGWTTRPGRNLRRARANGAFASAYVYCRETVNHDSAFHARMFVGATPSYEDPATGSAAAAFAGVVMHFDKPVDGATVVWIEQGMEMGRPSRIRLEIDVESGAMTGARIGGHAVKVAEGVLFA